MNLLVGPAGPLRVNENGHLARSETAENPDVSLCLSHPIVSPHPREIVDDGKWAIGWHDDAPGPFPNRQFALQVASGEPPEPAPIAKFRRFKIREARDVVASA